MKRITLILAAICVVAITVLSSCGASKPCPAYGDSSDSVEANG